MAPFIYHCTHERSASMGCKRPEERMWDYTQRAVRTGDEHDARELAGLKVKTRVRTWHGSFYALAAVTVRGLHILAAREPYHVKANRKARELAKRKPRATP